MLVFAAACPAVARDEPLAGTQPIVVPDSIYDTQYQQTEALLIKRIAQSAEVRAGKWKRDFSSPERYAASVSSNRATIAKLIGVGDRPAKNAAPATVKLLDDHPSYDTLQFEFPLYDDVRGDAICLLPKGEGPFPVVIVCHGDDSSPEQMCGEGKFPSRFASNDIAVLMPRFIPRSSDHADCTLYKKDLRYLIHRFSYVLARHPIGVDVDTVSRAIDSLPALSKKLDPARVRIVGKGQGGLTAMYAAALDPRITSTTIIDYFDDRSHAYEEPSDRAIFRHLVEFDDSDVCSVIAPRSLSIVSTNPVSAGFQAEFTSLSDVYQRLNSSAALKRPSIEDATEVRGASNLTPPSTTTIRPSAQANARRDELYAQLKSHFLAMIEDAAAVRAKRWANDAKTPDDWRKFVQAKRDAYLDLVGRCDFVKRVPLNPRSEMAYDTEDYVGYKILLDVFDGLEAYGILLIPRNIPPGERRPAVICQHGFAGNPVKTIGPGDLDQYYHRFPHTLAQRGYVTFTPYIVVPTEESEWKLDRRAKIVGESRVSICAHQYAAIVDFLQSLGFVDPNRIGFQGLSYGGFTGLWVVSQEPRISPVIVAGYFSDWKARLFDDPKGYMPIRSECMYVWDQMHTFNHSDLASMICPRPFFVEHGIQHGPAWMKWSGSEYRFVEALYTQLGIPERSQFYAFPGGHETGTEEAFRFLDKWLKFTPEKTPTGVEFVGATPASP
jgi:cephalosporin-C deacetylase-like acetyl esterase